MARAAAPGVRPAPSTRLAGWDAAGVLALAICLALAAALLVVVPRDDAQARLIVDHRAGQWAEGPHYRARLLDARLARSVERSYGDPLTAHPGAVLVVARWEVAVEHQTVAFRSIELVTGRYRYSERSETSTESYQRTQPGFTRTCVTVFEVPADRVHSARLVLGPPPASLTRLTRVNGFWLDADRQPVLDVVAKPEAETRVTQ